MPKFSADREVGHSARQMLDLVADVEAYPRFVPLCGALRVRERHEEDGVMVLVTDMTVAYKVFRETFTTRVAIDPVALTVNAAYLSGPFHHLDSFWSFEPVDEQRCRVRFNIDYAFRSRVLAAAMGTVFDRVFSKFSDAFITRADEIYGGSDDRRVRAG